MIQPASQHTIEPFWNRLREISLYPAHSAALTTIAALAVSMLVLYYLPTGLILGFILNMIVWIALYKYAFQCLRDSANGRLEPPEIAFDIDDDLGRKQIFLQVFFILVAIALFFLIGPKAALTGLLVLGFFYPAATMALAMDESLPNALNPGTWLAILTRFGWPYLAVAALCFVIFLSQAYAQSFAASILPNFLATLVAAFVSNYAIVATFHLMGYLIYQYHDEVGYEPVQVAAPLRRVAADPDQATLDEAAQLVQTGEPDKARERVAQQLRSHGGTEALHAQYRKLLALGEHRDEQLRHGREWISILLGQDRDRRAVDVARECIELDPAFQPNTPDEVSRIAQKALDSGNTQVAVKLVSGFHKRYPKHADIPKNYLLAAKLLAERMGKDAEARALLDQLTAAYPQHPLAGEIAAYRQFLDKLAPARGAS